MQHGIERFGGFQWVNGRMVGPWTYVFYMSSEKRISYLFQKSSDIVKVVQVVKVVFLYLKVFG